MIRILRILEYTFDTPERAEAHMGQLGVPLNGLFASHTPGDGMTIRSASIVDFDHNKEKPDPPPPEKRISEYEEGPEYTGRHI